MDNLINSQTISLSDCGQYLAFCTTDGQLKLWDTLSGNLKQEYTPSSHLSATCVRIVWPTKQLQPFVLTLTLFSLLLLSFIFWFIFLKFQTKGSPKKKRKRRSETSAEELVSQLELLALGTLNGNILLYSVVKSDLYSQLINGHEDRVNDICWLTSNDSIFSCSNDKYVIEWSISTNKIKQ